MKKNLQIYYNSIIIYDLISKLPRIKNQLQIPKIIAIHLNIGLRQLTLKNKKLFQC